MHSPERSISRTSRLRRRPAPQKLAHAINMTTRGWRDSFPMTIRSMLSSSCLSAGPRRWRTSGECHARTLRFSLRRKVSLHWRVRKCKRASTSVCILRTSRMKACKQRLRRRHRDHDRFAIVALWRGLTYNAHIQICLMHKTSSSRRRNLMR